MRNRVWISTEFSPWNDTQCALWVELGEGRMLWILQNGKIGFAKEPWNGKRLADRLDEDPSWEMIA